MEAIEIPFGAKDSELKGWEYVIPEGMEAEIKDGKIVVREKESEDERIRKALIKGLNFLTTSERIFTFGDISIEDIVAYLEKQKEQKPTPVWMPKFLDELRSKKNYFDWDEHREIEGHILAIINWIAPDYFDRKKKGQKSLPGFDVGREVGRVEAEQRPGWSEEEKRKLNRIYAILRQAADTHAFSTTCRLIGDKEAIELQDFLRSIAKPQVAEWSDEDERMLTSIIGRGSSQISPYEPVLQEAQMEWLMNKLKSLRPQPHWKPSEEQMEAFRIYLYSPQYIDNSEDIKIKLVESLYNDLKKLM